MSKVSIIIPAFQAEKCLERLLNSIRAQSFSDWEALIINDGSTDETFNIMRKYQLLDQRFKCITQENKGVSAARNAGLDIASSEYIAFADADDELEIEYLKKMISAAEERKADIVICGYTSIYGDEKILEWNPVMTDNIGISCSDMIKRYGINPLWNKLFRRDKIRKIFDEDICMGEDLRFVCDYLCESNSVAVVEEPLYRYIKAVGDSLSKNIKRAVESIMYDTASLEKVIGRFKLNENLVIDRFFDRLENCMEQIWCDAQNSDKGKSIFENNEIYMFARENIPQDIKKKFFRALFLLKNKKALKLYYKFKLSVSKNM